MAHTNPPTIFFSTFGQASPSSYQKLVGERPTWKLTLGAFKDHLTPNISGRLDIRLPTNFLGLLDLVEI